MAIGSTLRPELGRMDFSGIERGGRAAAEAIMRGSEQLGAGIRSAGASIGQAMEKTKEREFQIAEQQKAMKSQIAGTQTIIKGLLTLDGLPDPQKTMLKDFSIQLGNEDIPVSNRFNMAKQLTGVGSAIFEGYMESQKPQDIKPIQRFENAGTWTLPTGEEVAGAFDRVSGATGYLDTETNQFTLLPKGSAKAENRGISASQINTQVLEALGNLGKDPEDVTDADITRISGGNAILAGALREERSQAQAREARSAADIQTGKSPYQIEMDKATGQMMAKWVTEDRVKAVNNLSTLNTVVSQLQSGAIETRTVIDFLPNVFELPQYLRSIFASEEATAYAQVYGLVSQTLTEALGNQFTQIEGERQVNASYNPRLTAEQNIQLLDRTRLLVQKTIKAKDALAEYGNKTGGIRDYPGIMPITVLNDGLEELETLQSEMLGEDISRKPDYISTSSGGTFRVEEISTGK